MGAKFAFEGGNLTGSQVRDNLQGGIRPEAAKIIGDAATRTATGVNRTPGEPPRDGCAGGRLIALDWFCQTNRFRLRIPAHSTELAQPPTSSSHDGGGQ